MGFSARLWIRCPSYTALLRLGAALKAWVLRGFLSSGDSSTQGGFLPVAWCLSWEVLGSVLIRLSLLLSGRLRDWHLFGAIGAVFTSRGGRL
ncbi:hypothetical protein K505DRAFT_99968 [Melanomma pulvis-pyrius CBS 109.77]|uniref:Uncharacterized protein n=1 Tax=Melanomma pulvis-pyrius CBS 109.77 TaxID=1314802 RepID=A0A6A6WZ89_9PLEO|nr:hypothetical protein K505DRAFT_99968 [Melanomma pulvis-pyrius CBS 109.77]